MHKAQSKQANKQTNKQTKQKAKRYLEEAQQDFAFHSRCYQRNLSIFIDANDHTIGLPDDFIEISGYVEFRNRVLKTYRDKMRMRSNSFVSRISK